MGKPRGQGNQTDERRSRRAQRDQSEAGRGVAGEYPYAARGQGKDDKGPDVADAHAHVKGSAGVKVAARAGKDEGNVSAAQPRYEQAHAQEAQREEASRRGLLFEVVGDPLNGRRRPLLCADHEAPFLFPS